MSTEPQNPLAKFFRQPAIYLKLPSKGRWWPVGSLDMPTNNELPVYAMTTKDEIILKTPDALLNGQGVVDVIQNCVPNIKDAWQMPSIDVDAVLIAIRIATYGNNMSFESNCVHCKELNEHEIELSTMLDSIVAPDYSKTIPYSSLKIKLHPQPYFSVNKSNSITFEEQRLLNVINQEGIDPEVKKENLAASMQRLVDLGIESVADSTEYIEFDDGQRVTEKEYIKEFYAQAESSTVKAIQERLGEIAESVKIQKLTLHCPDCTKEYKAELTFDYANFFGNGS